MLSPEDRQKTAFLLSKCSMSRSCVMTWLRVPSFVSAIRTESMSGGYIDDRFILALIESLMDDVIANGLNYDGFSLKEARRGLNQLRRAVESENVPVT